MGYEGKDEGLLDKKPAEIYSKKDIKDVEGGYKKKAKKKLKKRGKKIKKKYKGKYDKTESAWK